MAIVSVEEAAPLDAPLLATTVRRVAHLVGFRDPDTFGRAFKREFGTSPSALKGANAASATAKAPGGRSRRC